MSEAIQQMGENAKHFLKPVIISKTFSRSLHGRKRS